MKEELVAGLTARNDRAACALADRIVAQSRETAVWYAYMDVFAALLAHPKSYVRNRAMHILAANARWDDDKRLDAILPEFLSHITDAKSITARQCVQALAELGTARPRHIPVILRALRNADLTGYADSMRPLIEGDIARTIAALELRMREPGKDGGE